MPAAPLPARLEILRQRLCAIPEQMGEALARTALSANIKERRDHSCALFDAAGSLLAQAAHIPVHLGSLGDSVHAIRRAFPAAAPGDVYLLNDPYDGGTHLPDITLIAAIHQPPEATGSKCPIPSRSAGWEPRVSRYSTASILQPAQVAQPPSALSPVTNSTIADATLVGYAVTRAHHADVGGAAPGSMAAATSIHAEGLRIPPVRWFARGVEQTEITRLILANVRTPDERLGDLRAQQAAAEIGRRGYLDLRRRHEPREFEQLLGELHDYAERRMRAALATIPPGTYECADHLEGDGVSRDPIQIRVALTVADSAITADFTGTSPAASGCVNCPEPVTRAAVTYALLCLAGEAMPCNAGMQRPIRIVAPPGSVVSAVYPAAVAAGNVETSQRIVDVVLGALAQAIPDRIPAGSAGTMHSLSLGGIDPRTGRAFTYYETIGGGSGATANADGESAIQTHMTNTRNTPIEALETGYPLRVRRYAVARGTGGGGAHRGGDGIIREITALAPMSGALLADRHQCGPAGRADGRSAKPGSASILHADGRTTPLESKCTFELAAGDTIQIITPGGGGYGPEQLA